jgi:hypothetical protein
MGENTVGVFTMKLRLRRSEARSAREARLRRMKCLPLANVKEKMWLKPRLQPHFLLLIAFCFAKSYRNFAL